MIDKQKAGLRSVLRYFTLVLMLHYRDGEMCQRRRPVARSLCHTEAQEVENTAQIYTGQERDKQRWTG